MAAKYRTHLEHVAKETNITNFSWDSFVFVQKNKCVGREHQAMMTDRVELDDKQSNLRIGGTLSLPLNKHMSIKLFASGAVLTSSGTDFTNAVIAWQYRWGGGL